MPDAARLEPHDIAWLEEPLYPSDDYDRMAQIRAKIRIPIAAGENLGNVNDFRWAIAAGAFDVVQPSAAKMGGISGVWKAMAHARDAKVRAVPHSPFHGPALIAALHVAAALPEDIVCEHRFCDVEASPLGDRVLAREGICRCRISPVSVSRSTKASCGAIALDKLGPNRSRASSGFRQNAHGDRHFDPDRVGELAAHKSVIIVTRRLRGAYFSSKTL